MPFVLSAVVLQQTINLTSKINMELGNAEEILQILERYTNQKSKTIPEELNGYVAHVAMTGDSVYSWPKVQYFFREKLAHVIKDFHDTTPSIEDLPMSRNVDAFNYDSMKTSLLERFDLFNSAPFTIQRLSELLSEPKKHYCRLDKFMRALEKNILVVSTVEPGRRQIDNENDDSINGDPLIDINVDVEMDKEPSSSVSITEKSIETQADADEASKDNTTEPEHAEVSSNEDDDKVTSLGHPSNDLDVNESKDDKVNDEQAAEADKTTDVEAITVEVQPNAVEIKNDSNELETKESTDVFEQISDVSPTESDVEPPNKSVDVDNVSKPLNENEATSDNVDEDLIEKKDSNEITVEVVSRSATESAKHSREDDDDELDVSPTSAKLPKLDQPDTEECESDVSVNVDQVPPTEILQTTGDCVASESKEEKDEPELVLLTANPGVSFDNQSKVDEAIHSITDVPADDNVELDERKCEPELGNTTSPLASTVSNDVDIDEQGEDEIIEPIITDSPLEENLLESSATLVETDVEMLPLKSIDNPEQMAVEDPTTDSLSVSTDMDATRTIPSNDEHMDVLENNLTDQMDQ